MFQMWLACCWCLASARGKEVAELAQTEVWVQHLVKIAETRGQAAMPKTGMPCSVLVAELTVVVTGLEGHPDFTRGSPWWRVAMTRTGYDYAALDAVNEVLTEAGAPFVHLPELRTVEQALRELKPDQAYVVQGWRRNRTGHVFVLLVRQGGTHGYVLESSKDHGVRLGGRLVRGMRTLPPPQRLSSALREYDAGVGYVPLLLPRTAGRSR